MHHYQNTCQGNFSLHLWMTTPTPRKHDPIFFSGWDPRGGSNKWEGHRYGWQGGPHHIYMREAGACPPPPTLLASQTDAVCTQPTVHNAPHGRWSMSQFCM